MAHAIWKGVIAFADIAVPVKLHSAVQDQDIHFHLLHDADHVRVQQRIVHPNTGAAVPSDQVRKGYVLSPNQLVVLSPEELESLTPEASRAVEITRFVPESALPPRWFERPYYLGPDGDAAPYLTLLQALANTRRQGIARWVMRKRNYVGALRAHGTQLVLLTLHFAGEVLDISKLETPDVNISDARELRLAESLLSALGGDFDPSIFHDDYRARVLELIDSKAKGRVISLKAWKPKRAKAESLATALQASLEQVARPRRKERARAQA